MVAVEVALECAALDVSEERVLDVGSDRVDVLGAVLADVELRGELEARRSDVCSRERREPAEAHLDGDGAERDADAGVDILSLGCEDGEFGDGEDVVFATQTASGLNDGVVDHEPLVHI